MNPTESVLKEAYLFIFMMSPYIVLLIQSSLASKSREKKNGRIRNTSVERKTFPLKRRGTRGTSCCFPPLFFLSFDYWLDWFDHSILLALRLLGGIFPPSFGVCLAFQLPPARAGVWVRGVGGRDRRSHSCIFSFTFSSCKFKCQTKSGKVTNPCQCKH